VPVRVNWVCGNVQSVLHVSGRSVHLDDVSACDVDRFNRFFHRDATAWCLPGAVGIRSGIRRAHVTNVWLAANAGRSRRRHSQR
jgi:hypothetical protein